MLTSLYKMNASEAVAKIIQTSTMRVFAPGTLFTFLRNSVSLGVGGMLIADGGTRSLRRVVRARLTRCKGWACPVDTLQRVGVPG